MARVGVGLLAVVGLLLTGAGLIAALAWGLGGLTTAGMLYVVGAALLASAIRWMRTHIGPVNPAAFAFVGAIIPVLGLWLALRGYWTSIPLLLLFVVGLYAPIALGGRPWGKPKFDRPGS